MSENQQEQPTQGDAQVAETKPEKAPKKTAEQKAAEKAEREAQKAAEKAKKDAEKAAKKAEAEKTASKPKDTKNGITRPGNGVTKLVWDTADKISAEIKSPVERGVLSKALEGKVEPGTIHTQYGRWRKYYGLTETKEARQQRLAVAREKKDAEKAAKKAEKEAEKAKKAAAEAETAAEAAAKTATAAQEPKQEAEQAAA